MALYDLIYGQQLPANITFGLGEGLSTLNGKYVISGFGAYNTSSAYFDFNDNLALLAEFNTPEGIQRIQYNDIDQTYWGLSTYINSTLYHFNLDGSLLSSFVVADAVPSADLPDRTPIAFSLSPDKSKIYIVWESDKQILSFNLNGDYLGKFPLDISESTVNGMTTDGKNLWVSASDFGYTFTMYKLNANLQIEFSFSGEIPTRGEVKDIAFDGYNFSPKCAIAIRVSSFDEGNDNMFVYGYEVPCPGTQPCQNPPTILASNTCLAVGSTFNPLNNVSATDCDGSDITAEIDVVKNTVDTSKKGVYEVIYSVISLINGLTTTKQILVSVYESSKRYQAITDIIQSVSMEQAALSHILNAEGEKIQKIASLDNVNAQTIKSANESVEKMVDAIANLELVLQSKLVLFNDCICDVTNVTCNIENKD